MALLKMEKSSLFIKNNIKSFHVAILCLHTHEAAQTENAANSVVLNDLSK